MRILVLGADGMLGHALVRGLQEQHAVVGSVRRKPSDTVVRALGNCEILVGFEALHPDELAQLLAEARAEVVVNCIGLVKQRSESSEAERSIRVNSLFPHVLSQACAATGRRLIQISTDCVFSGRKGGYTTQDVPDPLDLYGRSKLLGEVQQEGVLTLRTSMIGLELRTGHSLIEWFLRAGGTDSTDSRGRGLQRAHYPRSCLAASSGGIESAQIAVRAVARCSRAHRQVFPAESTLATQPRTSTQVSFRPDDTFRHVTEVLNGSVLQRRLPVLRPCQLGQDAG